MKKQEIKEITNDLTNGPDDVVSKIQALYKEYKKRQWRYFKGVMVLFCVVFIGWYSMKQKEVCQEMDFDNDYRLRMKLISDSTFDWCKVHPDSVKQQHFRYLFD